MFQARIGDNVIGVCSCMPEGPTVGTIVTGKVRELHLIGQPEAITGDTVIFPCGPGTVVGTAFLNITEYAPTSRSGDPVYGCANGNIISTDFLRIVGP